MKVTLVGIMAGAIAMVLSPGVMTRATWAQAEQPAPDSREQSTQKLTPAELDQLLAPIALYPDTLLGQILMAATYPLQIVEADRWLEEPKHAALKGSRLAAALEQQSWDPSVKALTPFARILRMMDLNLEWTEQLGNAFLGNQSSVMDTVQRLRRKAQAAGSFRSNAEQVVTVGPEIITITQPSPDTVYLPVYDPWNAYGMWPEPVYPPYYFPGIFDGVPLDPFSFGWVGIPVIGALWGWDRVDWEGNRIAVDPARWTALNRNRPPAGGDVWEHSAARGRSPARQAAVQSQLRQPSSERFSAPSQLRGEAARPRLPPVHTVENIRTVPPSARPANPGAARPAFTSVPRAAPPVSHPAAISRPLAVPGQR